MTMYTIAIIAMCAFSIITLALGIVELVYLMNPEHDKNKLAFGLSALCTSLLLTTIMSGIAHHLDINPNVNPLIDMWNNDALWRIGFILTVICIITTISTGIESSLRK